jgi:hypothetical protein
MFLTFYFTINLWKSLNDTYNLTMPWGGSSINDCLENWQKAKKVYKSLPIIVCWSLWLEINICMFDSVSPSTQRVSFQISGMLKSTHSQVLKGTSIKINRTPNLIMEYVYWFDGATQNNGLLSGSGGVLNTMGRIIYKWTLNCGHGTNTRAELLVSIQ